MWADLNKGRPHTIFKKQQDESDVLLLNKEEKNRPKMVEIKNKKIYSAQKKVLFANFLKNSSLCIMVLTYSSHSHTRFKGCISAWTYSFSKIYNKFSDDN